MSTPSDATAALAAQATAPAPVVDDRLHPILAALGISADTGAVNITELDERTKGLGRELVAAVREHAVLVRRNRPTVVTDADVFALVRELTHGEEVLRRVGREFGKGADECVGLVGEELLIAKGEQDGIPTGRLIVPDGDGTEIVVKAVTTRAPDTYDVSGIVGVVADVAARQVAAGPPCSCDGPEGDGGCEHHNPNPDSVVTEREQLIAAEVARVACTELLGLLSSPKWASTKLDAFARAVAAVGHDGDAGVLQQARTRGAEQWNGKTEVVRETAKTRRRG